MQEHGEFAVITNALPSVDSFFLIGRSWVTSTIKSTLMSNILRMSTSFAFSAICTGATLLSYLTLKELDKNNGGSLKFWAMFIVHRYIRWQSPTSTCEPDLAGFQTDWSLRHCHRSPRNFAEVLRNWYSGKHLRPLDKFWPNKCCRALKYCSCPSIAKAAGGPTCSTSTISTGSTRRGWDVWGKDGEASCKKQ